ncbi:hypothetical protein RFI_34278, partial [Reticulomyxa filosa]
MKKQYKYICSYPNDVQLNGHCVIQLLHPQTNSNEIDLLSFGGQYPSQMKQTFSMKYKSVWGISDHQRDSKSEHDSISRPFNTWIGYNKDTNIGKLEDDLLGVRGLIGGMNNDLLFITHYPKDIEVIDLKTMKPLIGVKNNIIPKEGHRFGIKYHCFVPLIINNEKVMNHFIFKYERTKSVHKYSMKEKTWNECKFKLPMEVSQCFATLSDYDTNIHVIGGWNAKDEKQKMH